MKKIIFLLCFWSVSVTAADYPMIIDPVANATPPGAKVSAAYFTLENDSDEKITITGVMSTTISKVEIHLSSIENDIAKMEKQESVSIEPGGTLKFEHGGYHLMLMDLTAPLKENDTIDIILETSVGEMLIEVPVKKIGSAMKHDGHGDGAMSDKTLSDTKTQTMDADHDMKKDGAAHTESTKMVH